MFDLGGELTRVRHACVVLARATLRAAAAPPPAQTPTSSRAAAAARERGADGELERLTAAFRFAFRVYQFSGGFDAETDALFAALGVRLLALSSSPAAAAAAEGQERSDGGEGAGGAAAAPS